MNGPIGYIPFVPGRLGSDPYIAIAVVVTVALLAMVVFLLYLTFAIPTPGVKPEIQRDAGVSDDGWFDPTGATSGAATGVSDEPD